MPKAEGGPEANLSVWRLTPPNPGEAELRMHRPSDFGFVLRPSTFGIHGRLLRRAYTPHSSRPRRKILSGANAGLASNASSMSVRNNSWNCPRPVPATMAIPFFVKQVKAVARDGGQRPEAHVEIVLPLLRARPWHRSGSTGL